MNIVLFKKLISYFGKILALTFITIGFGYISFLFLPISSIALGWFIGVSVIVSLLCFFLGVVFLIRADNRLKSGLTQQDEVQKLASGLFLDAVVDDRTPVLLRRNGFSLDDLDMDSQRALTLQGYSADDGSSDFFGVIKDSNGNYFVEASLLLRDGRGRICERGVIVCEWVNEEGKLSFKSSFLKPINIKGKLSVKALDLKTKNSVVIEDIHCAGILKVSSPNCHMKGSVTADTMIIEDRSHCILGLESQSDIQKIDIKTKLVIKPGSKLDVLKTDIQSTCLINHGYLYSAGKLTVDFLYSTGHIKTDQSQFSCGDLVQRSAVFNVNHSLVDIRGRIDSDASKTVVRGRSEIHAGHLQAGGLDIIKLNGGSGIFADDVTLKGCLVTQKGREANITKITVNRRLLMDESSKVSGNIALHLDAMEIIQAGNIELTSDLRINGAQLDNWGLIRALQLYLGLDDALLNLGTVSADAITAHSSVFNLGSIYTSKSYFSAGLLNVNMGLFAANSYSNNSFLSLNSGLVLPNFSADLRYILSLSNLSLASRVIATSLAPGYANLISLAYTIPSLALSGYGLYCTYSDLGWNKISHMRRHEWIPILCQLKSAAFYSYGAFNSAFSSQSEWSSLTTDVNNLSFEGLWNAVSGISWSKMGLRGAAILGGSYNDESLFQLNAGVISSVASTESSILNVNTGLDIGLIHTVNDYYFYNQGLSGGVDSAFMSRHIVNTGGLSGIHQFTMNATQLDNKMGGVINGTNVSMHVEQVAQQGSLILEGGLAELSHFEDSPSATTQLEALSARGQNFELSGILQANQVQLNYDNSINIASSAELKADNLGINTASFTDKGNCEFRHTLQIVADNITIESSANLIGDISDESGLFIPKESEGASNETNQVETEFHPQTVLGLHGQYIQLNGQIAGGDYTDITGKSLEGDEASHACQSVVIGSGADINLTRGRISAVDIENSGHTYLGEFQLDGQHLVQLGQLELHSCSGSVLQFQDKANASTYMNNTALKGQDFGVAGTLVLDKVKLEYEHSVNAAITADMKLGDTEIDTGEFLNQGQLEYHDQLVIRAKQIEIQTGASVVGQQTDITELFVPKEQVDTPILEDSPTAPDEVKTQEGSQVSSDPKEVEKDFKPQHVLIMEADTVRIDGQLSGGDYTRICGRHTDDEQREMKACNDIEVGASGVIDVRYGEIDANRLNIWGRFFVDNTSVNAEALHIFSVGAAAFNRSSVKGLTFLSDGDMSITDSSIKESDISFTDTAKEHMKNASFDANRITDSSYLIYDGQVDFVTDSYVHAGRIERVNLEVGVDSSLYYVKSGTVELRGEADIGCAYFDITHFSDGIAWVTGTGAYAKYHIGDKLTYASQDSLHLDAPLTRNCSLAIQASDIEFSTNYNDAAHDVSLSSTLGDVVILGNITANNVYVQSAHDVFTNQTVYASEALQFVADNKFYNLAGTINGKTVAIKASGIENISSDSYVWINLEVLNQLVPDSYLGLSSRWVAAKGSTGIINGRDNVYLESTRGDINNWGGVIRAGEYIQLIASGNVRNMCNGMVNFSTETPKISGGLIAGGAGSNTDGVGLYISAGAKILACASDFISNGSNYLVADGGFDFNATQYTYEYSWSTKGRLGKRITHREITTEVRGCTVQSASGYNSLLTEHGGVHSVATVFSTPGGTDIYAQGDVLLYSLKGQKKIYDSSSRFWGFSRRAREETYETSTPTLLIDDGATHISSTNGTVDARGAYFVGNGTLSIKAADRIKLGLDVLTHELIETSRGIGVSIPVLNGVVGWQKNGIWGAMTAEDATLSKLNSFCRYGNSEELLASSVNLGLNLYNTTNSLMRGLANDTLGRELLARYGLGGKDGFSPTINFTYNDRKTTTRYETLSQGGIDRAGDVTLEAGHGIDLENGVHVYSGGNIDINAPELIATAAALHSSITQKNRAVSLSASIQGVLDVGLSYATSRQDMLHFEGAAISAKGNLRLHCGDGAIHMVRLEGATINSNTLDADIDVLVIKDRQDVMHQSTTSISASVGGQISGYKGHGDSVNTASSSGIYVVDGINSNGHSVHVGHATMEGGRILTDGVNNIEIDSLDATTLVDSTHYSGVGIGFNLNDLRRFNGQTPTNDIGEQAIAIAQLNFDRVHDVVTQTPVVYGSQSTNAHINTVIGEIQTHAANGSTIITRKELHLELDIPVTNAAYLSQSVENIKAGARKALGFFKPQKMTAPKLEAMPEITDIELMMLEEELALSQPDKTTERKVVQNKKHPTKHKDIEKKGAIDSVKNKPKKTQIDKNLDSFVGNSNTRKLKSRKVNEQTEIITSSVLQLTKQWAEEVYGVFVSTLTSDKEFMAALKSSKSSKKLVNHMYLQSKSGFLTVGFNLALSGSDSSVKRGDVIKKGLAYTASDFSIGALFKLAGSEAEGPLGWGLTLICIIDDLTYSPKLLDKWNTSSQRFVNEGVKEIRQGYYLSSMGAFRLADEQQRMAAGMRAMHQVERGYEKLTDAFTALWNRGGTLWHKPDYVSSTRPDADNQRRDVFK